MTVATTGESKQTGSSRSRATGSTQANGSRTGSSNGSGKSSATAKRRRTGARTVSASIGEPTATVPVDDTVLAAANAKRALNPDMPRVAWLRSQLQQMEHRQRERLVKTAQLTVIAIIFITFVLQNAQPVNVHFLLFSLDIRLIWVIFGCGVLGGAAGYLMGRPDKSLRALLPQKPKKRQPDDAPRRPTSVKR